MDPKEVLVNLALRGPQARGAERVPWAPEEKLVHLALEKKETKEFQVFQEALVRLALLELLGKKVKWEHKALWESLELLVHKGSVERQGSPDPKVTVGQQDHRAPRATRGRRDLVGLQVNLDKLDHEALLEIRVLRDQWVNMGLTVKRVQEVSRVQLGCQV